MRVLILLLHMEIHTKIAENIFLKRIAFMTGCIVPKVLSVKLGGGRMSEFTFKIVIYLSRA